MPECFLPKDFKTKYIKLINKFSSKPPCQQFCLMTTGPHAFLCKGCLLVYTGIMWVSCGWLRMPSHMHKTVRNAFAGQHAVPLSHNASHTTTNKQCPFVETPPDTLISGWPVSPFHETCFPRDLGTIPTLQRTSSVS